MKNYLKTNTIFWNRKYGSPNPEGFIFRLKSKLLDYYIPKNKKLTVLDFGCGEGANIKHLIKSEKYDGYGVDISEESIKFCKKNINKKKFKLINSKPDKNDNFFNKKFDLIISIQTLYYLNDADLQIRLKSLNKMLKPGGYVFFTMMSTKSNYFKYYSNKRINSDGLTYIDLSRDKKYKKRQKQKLYHHYINMCRSEKDLKRKFKIFKSIGVGFYDWSYGINNLISGHHFTFFGKKIR